MGDYVNFYRKPCTQSREHCSLGGSSSKLGHLQGGAHGSRVCLGGVWVKWLRGGASIPSIQHPKPLNMKPGPETFGVWDAVGGSFGNNLRHPTKIPGASQH